MFLPNFKQAGIPFSKCILISLALSASQLAYSQNVGIGTLTPEDKLHILGNLRISGGRIYFVNTGESVFIGEEAGLNDDLTQNKNIFIGYHAGRATTSGGLNIAIGHNALAEALGTVGNIAIGSAALSSASLTGGNNLAIGLNSLQVTTTGNKNTGLGYNALVLNTAGSHNTALGVNALDQNTTGNNNVALGNESLGGSQTGNNNTAIGVQAGFSNQGYNNTFLGYASGLNNVSGVSNVFLGSYAGFNETGSDKLYISNNATSTPLVYGDFISKKLTINDTLAAKRFIMTQGAMDGYVLRSNANGRATWVDPLTLNSSWSISGQNIYRSPGNVGIGTTNPGHKLHVLGNIGIDQGRLAFYNTGASIFIGEDAGLNDDLTSNLNIYVGQGAGYSNTSGSNNIAIGAYSQQFATSAQNNIGIGTETLAAPGFSGDYNIALGIYALNANTTGTSNVAVGKEALKFNTTGSNNTGMGTGALLNSLTGIDNTAIGFLSGLNNGGSSNTFIGSRSGSNNYSGTGNVFIGMEAGADETGSNKLYIANSSTSSPLLYGDFLSNKLTVNDSLETSVFQMTSGAVDGYILSSNATGIATWIDPAALSTSVWSISGNNIYKNNSGNVGIGTMAPTDPLHVSGNINVNAGRLIMSNNGSSVFVGEDAGLGDDLSTKHNTIVGYKSAYTNSTGADNTALGSGALFTGSSPSENVAVGKQALFMNDGDQNVAIGNQAGLNATGSNNTFVGYISGGTNTGNGNVFLGYSAGSLETGSNKLYIENSNSLSPLIYGEFDLNRLTINDTLIAKSMKINSGKLNFINTGKSIFIGENAGAADDLTDNQNTFIGYQAGNANTTGSYNTALGFNALKGNTTATYNTAIGYESLTANAGNENVALGVQAGWLATGSKNTFMGTSAGALNTGTGNVFIGHSTGSLTGSNQLYIDNSNASTPLIYGDFSSDKVGINNASPSSTFDVGGTIAMALKNSQVAGTNNPDGTASVWKFTTGSGTITLPAANTCANRMYVIVNATGASRTISPNYTNLSNASVNSIANATSITLMSDGSGWTQVR